MKRRVLIVDDQRLFCEGLRVLLETYDDLEVVGEAHDGKEGVEKAVALRPDVVLMDLSMPVMDGVTATERILERAPNVRVLALTTFDDDENVLRAVRAGAAGYLLKDCPASVLRQAIETAARGESYLSPSVTETVLSELRRLSLKPAVADLGLSRREIEVLALLADGASNKEIGKRLFIAEGTVKNHLTNIFTKLEVDDRVKAALRAKDLGIL